MFYCPIHTYFDALLSHDQLFASLLFSLALSSLIFIFSVLCSLFFQTSLSNLIVSFLSLWQATPLFSSHIFRALNAPSSTWRILRAIQILLKYMLRISSACILAVFLLLLYDTSRCPHYPYHTCFWYFVVVGCAFWPSSSTLPFAFINAPYNYAK